MTVHANQLAGLAAAIADMRLLPAPADAMLYQFFRRHPAMGQQDRALVAEGVFAWLRRRRSLEQLAATTHPAKLALAVIVRELGRSLRDVESAITATDADWVRAFKARLGGALPDAVAADVPDWLWDRLGTEFGAEERVVLTRSWLAPAPLDLRVNPLKATRDEVWARLAASGIDAKPTPYSPLGLRVEGRPALSRHPLLLEGFVEIQDEGSQLVGYLVAPQAH